MRTVLPVALAIVASQAALGEVIVLRGATLIDGTGRPPRQNATLVIDGDRISAVGDAARLKFPAGARVVEVRGRTIMPGIINAHGHVGLVAGGQNRADAYTRENVQPQLLQYERYGVTSGCIAVHGRAWCRRSRRGAAGSERTRSGLSPQDCRGSGRKRARSSHPQAGLLQDLGG